MANVVRALAHHVKIAPVWVRVPSVAATKNDIGKPPCTEGAPRKVDVKPEPDL